MFILVASNTIQLLSYLAVFNSSGSSPSFSPPCLIMRHFRVPRCSGAFTIVRSYNQLCQIVIYFPVIFYVRLLNTRNQCMVSAAFCSIVAPICSITFEKWCVESSRIYQIDVSSFSMNMLVSHPGDYAHSLTQCCLKCTLCFAITTTGESSAKPMSIDTTKVLRPSILRCIKFNKR